MLIYDKHMAKGDNPNSRKNLKPLNTRTKKEQREIATMGGKASGESRRAFATFKECFKHEMTDEQMKLAYKKLWDLFLKDGKIEAFDRLKDIMDGSDNTANNITINFGSQEMEEYGD